MKQLREIAANNKKLVLYLVLLTALGVAALMLGRFVPGGESPVSNMNGGFLSYTPNPEHQQQENTGTLEAFLYERALEKRLEEFFSLVEGAGQVRVMVSPVQGRETVFAVDVSQSRSYSKEEDAQGGSRETRQYQSQEQTVMITDRQGTNRPLILREIEPRIQGIVIIAEGGGNPHVQLALTNAARAMLGLDAHTIQVLQKAAE